MRKIYVLGNYQAQGGGYEFSKILICVYYWQQILSFVFPKFHVHIFHFREISAKSSSINNHSLSVFQVKKVLHGKTSSSAQCNHRVLFLEVTIMWQYAECPLYPFYFFTYNVKKMCNEGSTVHGIFLLLHHRHS